MGQDLVEYGGDKRVLCNFGVEGWLVIFPEALTGIKSCNAVAGESQKHFIVKMRRLGRGLRGRKGFHVSLTHAGPEKLLP